MEVCVRARSAVLWSQVDLRIEVLRHGGIALLTGGLLGVQRHFGTFNDDVMNFILFPPTPKQTKDSSIRHKDLNDWGGNNQQSTVSLTDCSIRFTWWGQAHGLLYPLPVLGGYAHVPALAGGRDETDSCI